MEITQNQGKKDFKIYLVRQKVREKMDTPNASNPANPNAQDQFVDAVQGSEAQNQAQGLADQGPAVQGLTTQGPANNKPKLATMYPFSLHNN